MKRRTIIAALAMFAGSAASANVKLIQVPAACSTVEDIQEMLSVNMATRQAVGKGGNSRGEDLVVLLAGTTGYWALVATMSPTSVCVVASGRNWTNIEAGY
ncbi:MAG: hypothetical protein WD036_09280 [Bauldia sp.]